MTPAVRLACFAAAVALTLFGAWALGLSAIRDEGGYPDGWRTTHGAPAWYRLDKLHHAVGGFLTFAVGATVTRYALLGGVFAVTVAGWCLVELAQRSPRVPYKHGGPGFASWRDAVASALGAALAWGVVAVAQGAT